MSSLAKIPFLMPDAYFLRALDHLKLSLNKQAHSCKVLLKFHCMHIYIIVQNTSNTLHYRVQSVPSRRNLQVVYQGYFARLYISLCLYDIRLIFQ